MSFIRRPAVVRRLSAKALVAAVTLFALPALADFDGDFQQLRYALEFSRFSDAQLDAFRDPQRGPRQFRLNEKNAPWAGNYFPMAGGGIASRWQGPDRNTYPDLKRLPTLEELKALPQKTLDGLSPTEKFDIVNGRYDFPATTHELQRRGPLREFPKVQNWEGFCNGVRCAGILLPEPKHTVEVVNDDGIRIRFQPADLKALAGASYFYVEKYAQIGGPSREGRAAALPDPAVFDMALRYYVGQKKKAFVIDSHLGSEVWNESVVGYRRELGAPEKLSPAESAANPAAVSKVHVKLVLDTLGELQISESNKPTKKRVASGEVVQELKTAYWLFLDGAGKSVGGEWKLERGNRGIDFAWFGGGKGTDAQNFGGNQDLPFNKISRLVRQSASPSCKKVFTD